MARPVDPRRHDEVLDRAVMYLAEHGLNRMSLRSLAASMGVSTNTISYQFGSKAGLVDAALKRARASTVVMFAELRADNPDITVGSALLRLWDWWMADPNRIAFPRLNMEAMMTTGEAELDSERRNDLLTYWISYFGRWLTREGFSRAAARDRATLILATLSGLLIDLITTGDERRIRKALVEFTKTLEYPGSHTGNGSVQRKATPVGSRPDKRRE